MDEMVLSSTIIPAEQIHLGLEKILDKFGEKNVWLYNNGDGQIICLVFMPLPEWFLRVYGTGDKKTDEYIFQIRLSWFCDLACTPEIEKQKKRRKNNGHQYRDILNSTKRDGRGNGQK